MSADLAIQAALRARLIETEAVTGLVPAASILDRNARPAPDPAIILGEGQAIDEGRVDRKTQRIFATLHVWKREAGLVGAKTIASAIRAAVHAAPLVLEAPFQCGDAYVSDMRFLRDPDGETAHGVVTVEAIVSEV